MTLWKQAAARLFNLCGALDRAIMPEHQSEYRGLLESKGEIGLSHRDHTVDRAFAFRAHGGDRPLRQTVETLLNDGFKYLELVAKMLVGSGRRNTRNSARIRQRKIFGALLDEQLMRRIDQRLA